MRLSHRSKWFGLAAVVTLAVSSMAGERIARAQLEPDLQSFGIYEPTLSGPYVLRGEIFRVGTDSATYTEHWVLYPGYVYPSAQNGVHVEIVPGLHAYSSERDFLSRVSFPTGSRYVKAACADGTRLPGR